jgi:lysylphosphatidylglycerol synthetase-like protein (DUF2156 family)
MHPGVLVAWGVVGLLAGWLYHWIIDHGTGTAPLVSWAQPAALVLVAAVLFVTAWSTRRTIRLRPGGLSPSHAVNRLVLARACAYVGALAGGVYLGYAVSWLGVESDLAHQRALRSACAGVAGVLMVIAGVLLERACRVPPEDDAP